MSNERIYANNFARPRNYMDKPGKSKHTKISKQPLKLRLVKARELLEKMNWKPTIVASYLEIPTPKVLAIHKELFDNSIEYQESCRYRGWNRYR